MTVIATSAVFVPSGDRNVISFADFEFEAEFLIAKINVVRPASCHELGVACQGDYVRIRGLCCNRMSCCGGYKKGGQNKSELRHRQTLHTLSTEFAFGDASLVNYKASGWQGVNVAALQKHFREVA